MPSFYVGKHMDLAAPSSSRRSSAHQAFYARDVEYVVRDGEVIIVDEFTGRLMEGRTLERGPPPGGRGQGGPPKIKEENQTLATITLQNYFRLYDKLAGMTGTAITEAGRVQRRSTASA